MPSAPMSPLTPKGEMKSHSAKPAATLIPFPRRAATDPDQVLARRAAAGDEAAFDRLVERYADRVFGVAYRILQDRAEAEDLCQEVFVTLHGALQSFRGDAKLSTWIYRITHNRGLNRLKFLQRRHLGRMASLDDPHAPPLRIADHDVTSSAASAEHQLQIAEMSAALEAALRQLPEEQRVLVVFRDLEDLSYDEIADITGLAMGTVKSRIHRARMALADLLRPEFAEAFERR